MVTAFSVESLHHRLLTTDPVRGPKGLVPDAAVAVMFKSSRSTSSLLLIRRTEKRGDPWSGQIAFPGGHRARTDGSFLETAMREANEEVGISLGAHAVLGFLPPIYARTRRIRVVPFVFQLRRGVSLRPNREVADAFWVSVNELVHCKVVKSKVRVEGCERTVDSYVVDGKMIWGLTFRIIRILLSRNRSKPRKNLENFA